MIKVGDECHSDHPTFKFSIWVNYVGKPPETEEEKLDCNDECHALIYADGNICLTMYEYTYAMFFIRGDEIRSTDGKPLSCGHCEEKYYKENYRISDESLEKIKASLRLWLPRN